MQDIINWHIWKINSLFMIKLINGSHFKCSIISEITKHFKIYARHSQLAYLKNNSLLITKFINSIHFECTFTSEIINHFNKFARHNQLSYLKKWIYFSWYCRHFECTIRSEIMKHFNKHAKLFMIKLINMATILNVK